MFCRLKEFRRVATRYDKLARNYLSALALAAAIAFWLWRISILKAFIRLDVFQPAEDAEMFANCPMFQNRALSSHFDIVDKAR